MAFVRRKKMPADFSPEPTLSNMGLIMPKLPEPVAVGGIVTLTPDGNLQVQSPGC